MLQQITKQSQSKVSLEQLLCCDTFGLKKKSQLYTVTIINIIIYILWIIKDNETFCFYFVEEMSGKGKQADAKRKEEQHDLEQQFILR